MILFRMPWQRTCQRFIWLAFLSFMGSVSSIAYGFFFTHCSDYLGDRIKLVNSEKPSNIIATKSNSFDRYSPGSPLVSTKAAKYARRLRPRSLAVCSRWREVHNLKRLWSLYFCKQLDKCTFSSISNGKEANSSLESF